MADATPTADVYAKPRRRFRRLRIAVSVFFGVVCVIYCVFWVRDRWNWHGIGAGQITYSDRGTTIVVLPYWCMAVLAGLFAVLPWHCPRQYSLRTLLTATTLIAFLLGLAVLAFRMVFPGHTP